MGDHQSLISKLIFLFLFWSLFWTNSTWAQIDSIEWGPEVGISFPQPLQIGAVAACSGDSFFCHPDWKYYLDTGFLWLPLNSNNRALNEFSVETGTRYTPFSFPLTFAFGMGYRFIGFSTADIGAFTIGGSEVASNASLNFYTFYVIPSLGWQLALSDHLDLGIQAGVQIAIYGNGSLFLSNQATGANSNNSNQLSTDNGQPLARVASLALPALTLVRLTWRLE